MGIITAITMSLQGTDDVAHGVVPEIVRLIGRRQEESCQA